MSGQPVDSKLKGKASRWLRMLFWLIAVLPLAWIIVSRSGDILRRLEGVTLQMLGFPLGFLILILPLMALNSWVSLRYLGGAFSFFEAAGFYFSSQGPKYLPGGFWAFPSRMVFYRSKGLPSSYAVLSVFREVAALFLGAAAVGALGVVNGITSPGMQTAVLIGVGISFAAILLTSTAFLWKLAARIPASLGLPFDDLIHDREKRSLKWLPPTFLVSVLFWIVLGFPFRSLILAFEPAASVSWLQAASIFSLAWCGGFVVIVIPAGLGVRESLLTLLLSFLMPEGSALTIALAARVWWMAAESVYIVVSWYWLIRTTRFAPILKRLRMKAAQSDKEERYE